MKNEKKRARLVLCMVLSAVLAVTMCMPLTAFAASATWTPPTVPMSVDDGVVTVGAHCAATTAVHYLGGNLVTERKVPEYSAVNAAEESGKGPAAVLEAAQGLMELGVFGTSVNDSPDPYLWNYFYNLNVAANPSVGTAVGQKETFYFVPNNSNPANADTTVVDAFGTSATLSYRPDVLYGTGGDGYDALIAQLPENQGKEAKDWVYNPVQVPYQLNDIYVLVDNMYALADGMAATGKKTRYEEAPVDIAKRYEAFIRGIQLYILSQIDAGKLQKKTVAVIAYDDVQGEGETLKYRLIGVNDKTGNTASNRGAENVQYTCNNIIDVAAKSVETADDKKYMSAREIARYADIVVPWQSTGNGGGNTTEEAIQTAFLNAGVKEKNIPAIYAVDPGKIFSFRTNSAENIFGVAALQGFFYPEVIDPIQCYMYLYKNFYHISDNTELIRLATASFSDASLAEGINRSPSTFDEKAIDNMISAGLSYYADNAAQVEKEASRLVPTDRLDVTAKTAQNLKIKITNKTFKASALKSKKKAYKAAKVTGNKTTVTYKIAGSNAKAKKALSIDKKTGKLTVKKGTKKGTYKATITATAAANKTYQKAVVSKTVKITVK